MTATTHAPADPAHHTGPSRRLLLGGLFAGATALAAPVTLAAPAEAAPVKMTTAKSSTLIRSLRSRYVRKVPYRYGGMSMKGFDCSGLTKHIYASQKVHLPRTSREQYTYCRKVSRAAARPGDLVFFFTNGRVTHVGVYVGNNKMIDAGNPRTGVSERTIYSKNVKFGTRR